MDYAQIYTNLIERGLTRTLGDGVYLEKHHVWPKCMGGPDEESNLVKLTPEEHYLAHQLLVKMFPDNRKLVFAANMMCKNKYGGRVNNKMYGWLRKKHSKCISQLHKGKPKSEETKSKISKNRSGKRAYNKGVSMSSEQKEKISKSKKGSTVWNKGKSKIADHVDEIKFRYNNGETQRSIADYFKIDQSVISKIVRGKYSVF